MFLAIQIAVVDNGIKIYFLYAQFDTWCKSFKEISYFQIMLFAFSLGQAPFDEPFIQRFRFSFAFRSFP